MSSYQLTQSAEHDLWEIWNYTYDMWGETQADHYLSEIKDACITIVGNPDVGRVQYPLHRHVRVYRCNKHYIFYKTEIDVVTVLAILHEKMDAVRRVRQWL